MVHESLKKYFGFTAFKEGQEEVIRRLVAGESAAAIFPTGAGKSLCYQLPAMLLPGLTLVVSPLLSLMKDQVDFLVGKKIPAARLDSTLDRQEFNTVLEDARQGRLKILMISVERFRNERFRVHLARMRISLLVVDEAHCISEWGHNFRPEYLNLPRYRQDFAIAQVLLLTATATPRVVADMCGKFEVSVDNVTLTGFYRANLFLQVSPAPEPDKDSMLVQRLTDTTLQPAIVYVTLQKTAERIAALLSGNGIETLPYHAGMKNEERESIQQRFMDGSLGCVAATIAFGMGIDKADIRSIIHYDLPKTLENYSQEIGRAGRDGQPAFCEVLANRDGLTILENFVYGDTPEKAAIGRLLADIRKHSPGRYEVKIHELSQSLNIRVLPLKTLFVYLDMHGALRPRFSYMKDYDFKQIEPAQEIIDRFQGERRDFVAAIFNNCHAKKVWTSVDIQAVIENYRAERQRIIAALEYFDEQGMIELRSKSTVEVYEATAESFDMDELTEKMFTIFQERENHETERLQRMVGFFESGSCISHGLARYFGQDIAREACGHCSVCKGEKVKLEQTAKLPPLETHDFTGLSADFIQLAGERLSVAGLTRFLCGIFMPAFSSRKVGHLAGSGALENYSFPRVRDWVERNLIQQSWTLFSTPLRGK